MEGLAELKTVCAFSYNSLTYYWVISELFLSSQAGKGINIISQVKEERVWNPQVLQLIMQLKELILF